MLRRLFLLVIILSTVTLLGFYVFKKEVGNVSIPKQAEEVKINAGEPVPYLKVPEGFEIRIFAKDLPAARVIEFDPAGRILVSQTREGKIAVLEDKNGDGLADVNKTLVSGLKNPHGMAFRCEDGSCDLYVAESNALSRFSYNTEAGSVSDKTKLVPISYSSADRHFTRTLLFLPYPYEDTLLVSVGSSCDVCHEDDEQRARILSYDIKTGRLETYARGLRNAVFMTLNPINGLVFLTEMGRDGLGDNIPPDEVNVIEPERFAQEKTVPNFGWPICYGKNIHDDNFDKNTYIRNPCMEPFETPSWLDLEAHSAPLGLAFIPEEGWPEEYWYSLLVAYHGSWNRSVPTGYKIVRTEIDGKGNPSEPEDFISGWLTQSGEKLGRPVDIKVLPGGVAYISDDNAGVIYRLTRR
jgi:glucose/arabinose dehydrogenase